MILPKEYTTIAITVQNLVRDGWELKVNNKGVVEVASNEESNEHFQFCTEKEFKDWILEKALDY